MGTRRFTGSTTVDEVIGCNPMLTRVLETHGIDTCCGGGRTLGEATAEQGVELNALLEALHTSGTPGVVQPQSPPAAQPTGRLPSPTRYLRFLVASLLFALTFGSALGACMLASMTLPWNLLHGLPLAAVKMAHAYAQVYGFATLFIMGVAYHVVARFKGTELAAPNLARASFWLQVGGVLTVALGALAGAPFGGPAQVAGSMALLSSALVFLWNIDRTIAADTTPAEPYESYLRAGCAWFVVATGIGLVAATTGKVTLQAAMWESALWGFIGFWLFGMSLRILPVFMGVAPTSSRAARRLFIGYQVAVAAWVTVALVEEWSVVTVARAFAGAALVATTVGLVLRIGVLGRRERSPADDGGYAKFIVAAYVWLLLALVFAPGWTAAAALHGAGAVVRLRPARVHARLPDADDHRRRHAHRSGVHRRAAVEPHGT